MKRRQRVAITVDLGAATRNGDVPGALDQVTQHILASARRLPGVDCTDSGFGFGHRDMEFECDGPETAETLRRRIGESLTVHVDDREMALPVRLGVSDVDNVRVFVKARDLAWDCEGEESWCDPDDRSDYAVLVKVPLDADPSGVAAALRRLAEDLEREVHCE